MEKNHLKQNPDKSETYQTPESGVDVEMPIPQEIRTELVGEEFSERVDEVVEITRNTECEVGFARGVRVQNGEVVEVVTSSYILGERHTLPLYKAQNELEEDLDVVNVVNIKLHSHPDHPEAIRGLSDADIQVWKQSQRKTPLFITDQERMELVGVRPIFMVVEVEETPEQSRVLILAQMEDEVDLDQLAEPEVGRMIEFAIGLLNAETINERETEQLQRLEEVLAERGFRFKMFGLQQREEIQAFLLEHVPEKLLLKFAPILADEDFPPLDLSFLDGPKED